MKTAEAKGVSYAHRCAGKFWSLVVIGPLLIRVLYEEWLSARRTIGNAQGCAVPMQAGGAKVARDFDGMGQLYFNVLMAVSALCQLLHFLHG